jgi:transposase
MSKAPHFILTGKMVRDMCAKSPRERLLHRVHCVALVSYGFSASEVARIFKDSPRAVAYWVKRYKKDGLKGLHEDSRSGRPSKLTAPQMEKLGAFVAQSRAGSQSINAEKLSKYIHNEFGVSITIRQCWRILKKLTT